MDPKPPILQPAGVEATNHLIDWLDRALILAPDAVPLTSPLLADLRGLRDRLAGERLQLAVVGQFKRGKSTLMNALLGAEILPTGVLPLTAVPTFLEWGARPELLVKFEDGTTRDVAIPAVEDLSAQLASLVTEDGNPKNAQGLSQVTVRMPSALLEGGVVLIDTPGVGSTLAHNTATAEAVLPASDAALFVVSPDPPITAVEVDFLTPVRATAARVVVVLNKADLLAGPEIAAVEGFLRRTLAVANNGTAPMIFRVSARDGLRAKLSGDEAALRASGLPALESYLKALITLQKRAVLGAAIAGKAQDILASLRLQNDLALQALRLPLDDLERRRGVFQEAIRGFEADRQAAQDLLVGDRKRILQKLDDEAQKLSASISGKLKLEVEGGTAGGRGSEMTWQAVRQGLPAIFEVELNRAVVDARAQLEAVFEGHQARLERLTNLVQRTAAELMDVPFQPAPLRERYESERLPYWVVKPTEGLNPIPPGALEAMLPPALRVRRARQRIGQEIEAITVRNVENLRWSIRQNLEEAFRRFAAELDAGFAASLMLTRDVMDEAFRRRKGHAADIDAELDRRQSVSLELGVIERRLAVQKASAN